MNGEQLTWFRVHENLAKDKTLAAAPGGYRNELKVNQTDRTANSKTFPTWKGLQNLGRFEILRFSSATINMEFYSSWALIRVSNLEEKRIAYLNQIDEEEISFGESDERNRWTTKINKVINFELQLGLHLIVNLISSSRIK